MPVVEIQRVPDLDPNDRYCEDCGEDIPKGKRRRRCLRCMKLVCVYCFHHVHHPDLWHAVVR